MDRRRLHNDLGDSAVAGIENMIPLVLQQLSSLVGGAVDDQEGLAVEVAGQELSDDLGRVLGHLRWLEHRSTSGGNGANQGAEGEEDGVVPGGNDQGGA